MGKPWVPYVVQQGDHLDRLAFRFGSDADTVWNHAKNKDLKAKRKNRDTLCPGDVLFVPGEPPPALDVQVGTKNGFQATVPKVPVKLTLASRKGPLADKAFVVDGAGGDKPIEGKTTASGEIAFEVPVWVREVSVRVPDLALLLPVHVGGLDPIEERSGVVQRLSNLGYLPKTPEVPDAWVAQAIRRFQRDHDLEPTGELDAKTKDALEKEHKS